MYSKFEALLEENNTTAYRVSRDTGISEAAFSKWKQGKSSPRANNIIKLANYFGVQTEHFFNNSKEKGELIASKEINELQLVLKNNIFGRRLKKLREEIGSTQIELSAKFNLSKQVISSYENGFRIPNVEQVIAFAKFFDVSIDYLLGVSDSCNRKRSFVLTKKRKATMEELTLLCDDANERDFTFDESKTFNRKFDVVHRIDQRIKLLKKHDQQEEDSVELKVCPKCQCEVTDSARFCIKCGYRWIIRNKK